SNPTISAELVVRNTTVVNGMCVVNSTTVPVVCGQRVDIRLVAPPCPARPPRSGSAPNSGPTVVGESVTLQVTATDACGNSSTETARADGCAPAAGQCPGGACPIPVA